MSRSLPVVLLALITSVLAACGGDGNDDESGDTTAASGSGMTVEIDPTSGPPGTVVEWSISGCDADEEKSVSIYDLPLEEYETGAKSKPLTQPMRGQETSGTLTVPAGIPPGDYTFTGGCTSETKTEPGTFTIGVKGAETAFEVTD